MSIPLIRLGYIGKGCLEFVVFTRLRLTRQRRSLSLIVELAPAVLLLPVIQKAWGYNVSPAQLRWAAFTTEQLFNYLTFEFQAESPLIYNGRVLSLIYFALPCLPFLTFSIQFLGFIPQGVLD